MLTRLPFRSAAELRGKRVLVVGLGTKGGGTETVRWLATHGAEVTVTDQKHAGDLRASLESLRGLPVRTVLGEHRVRDVETCDLVVRNPAVPLTAPLLRTAAALRVPVVMDTTLFFQFCEAPIAGITGTRGKSTTTVAAGRMLRRSRPETVVSGNIERSPLAYLDGIRRATPVILELSSWQLEGIEPLRRSPHWAVVTTILQDHLNRYPSMEAYVSAKETLVKHQTSSDQAMLPADDPWGQRFAEITKANVRWFGVSEGKGGLGTEGLDGLFRVGDAVVLRNGDKEERLLAWSEIRGTGDHTKRNMLAGALLALEMEAPLPDVLEELRTFRGLENRLETVSEYQHRTFVNDTTATTPEAVIAALHSFPGRRLVLVTGGTDKNLSYDGLAVVLARAKNLRAVVLLAGSATEKLLSALQNHDRRVAPDLPVRSMGEAVRAAWEASKAGDVVLLSPGAASFELFRDEFDRGQQFRDAVARLGE